MTRKEAVKRALSHHPVFPCPYNCDMSESLGGIMRRYTGDSLFYEHTGSYLSMQRNESFTDEGAGMIRDQYGVVWDRGRQDGDFGVVHEYQLKRPSLVGYSFPEPDEKLIRENCEKLAADREHFTMYVIGFSLFERAWTLRSMEETLCDMLDEQEFMDELLDRIVDYNLKVVRIASEYPIDCIFFGDDWGMQKGLIMGYPLWKRFLFPRISRQYAYVHSAGMYVAQHSCGDCSQVFPDLVQAGLDIYNTFQPEVYDIEYFKKTYGSTITFFGGISTQRLLPYKTPAEVEAECRRILGILSKDGGYIMAPTHAAGADTPPENFLAFLKVCRNQ